MRNDIQKNTSGVKKKNTWNHLILASLISFNTASFAMDDLEVILDGYAYQVNSDVIISLPQQFIFIANSEMENCMLPNGLPPSDTAGLSLITNNQGIGIKRFRYAVESRLLFLTSETSNVVCDNGLFIDQIFFDGFE